tara:strand:- start:238 stop:420 length:183 start_codon:yes stop_codon:yes gene_type:complete
MNIFKYKIQSNGLFSISIRNENNKPYWQYKNLTFKEMLNKKNKYKNAINQLYKNEILINL